MVARATETVSQSPVQRVEFIKCRTEHCRHNLGVQMGGGKVYWHVPVVVDLHSGTTEITCPCCNEVRTWDRKRRS